MCNRWRYIIVQWLDFIYLLAYACDVVTLFAWEWNESSQHRNIAERTLFRKWSVIMRGHICLNQIRVVIHFICVCLGITGIIIRYWFCWYHEMRTCLYLRIYQGGISWLFTNFGSKWFSVICNGKRRERLSKWCLFNLFFFVYG